MRKEEKSLKRVQERTNSLVTPAQNAKVAKPHEGTIICHSWNSEAFIKRAAKQLGWHQLGIQGLQKQTFHIRFDIEDLEGV